MGTTVAPRPPDLTPEERERRNACKELAGRIRAYLPTLRAQEERLETELGEVRKLIADELRQYDLLLWAATVTAEEAAHRDQERAA